MIYLVIYLYLALKALAGILSIWYAVKHWNG